MNTHSIRPLSTIAFFAVLFAACGIFLTARAEETTGSTSVNVHASSSVAGKLRLELQEKMNAETKTRDQKILQAKQRAKQEIDRRIASLNVLIARLGGFKRVSDSVKSELSGDVNVLIESLKSLDTKIQSSTATSTLKTDIQSITGSYRVYLLVIPKGHLLAAADRIKTTAGLMTTTGTKLKTAMDAAKAGGKDTASLETLLADATAKIADSNVQADAAIALLTPLKPDEKNNVVFEANKKALMDARAKIKAGSDDLKAARDDMHKIYNDLKPAVKGTEKMKVKASASGSTSTKPE